MASRPPISSSSRCYSVGRCQEWPRGHFSSTELIAHSGGSLRAAASPADANVVLRHSSHFPSGRSRNTIFSGIQLPRRQTQTSVLTSVLRPLLLTFERKIAQNAH